MKPTDRSYAVDRTEEEWKATLSPDEYQVLRQAGTERPYTGEYTDAKTVGTYACRACGAELFTSETKFDSHCGWPSFFSPLAGESVELLEDRSLPGRPRTEVRCATCGSHLGHVFEGEGYDTPTDQRFCINSISLTLRPADERPDRLRSGAPGRVAADEAEHPVLGAGVVGHRHPRAVLARGAQQLVDGLHALEQLGAQRRVEGVVLAGRAGEVPGVHEHVGRVEPVDRLVQRQVAGVRVRERAARRWPGSSSTACTASAWVCHAPTGSSATDGPSGSRTALPEARKGGNHSTRWRDDVAGGPVGHRRRRVPVGGARDGRR